MQLQNSNAQTQDFFANKASLLMVLTASMWSIGGVITKFLSWNPLAIASYRAFFAALVLLAVLKKPRFRLSWPFLLGVFSYAAMGILFISSTKLTTAANAILLQYTAPIYIAVFGAILLKEKASRADWALIAAVMGGMALFFMDDLKPGDLLGNAFAILAGIAFAFSVITLRMQKDQSPLEIVFWGNALTALIGLPFATGQGIPDAKSLALVAIMGIFQIGIPYIIYSGAIRHITALQSIIISIIEPILNPLWVMLFFGEKPGKWAIWGGIIVVISISLRNAAPYIAANLPKKAIGATAATTENA